MTTRTPQAAPISTTLDPAGWLLQVPANGGALERVPCTVIFQPGSTLNLRVRSVTFPDGTVATTANAFIGATGARGATGAAGAAGASITSITNNGTGTLTITYSDGTNHSVSYPYTPPSSTGGTGGAGGGETAGGNGDGSGGSSNAGGGGAP